MFMSPGLGLFPGCYCPAVVFSSDRSLRAIDSVDWVTISNTDRFQREDHYAENNLEKIKRYFSACSFPKRRQDSMKRFQAVDQTGCGILDNSSVPGFCQAFREDRHSELPRKKIRLQGCYLRIK